MIKSADRRTMHDARRKVDVPSTHVIVPARFAAIHRKAAQQLLICG